MNAPSREDREIMLKALLEAGMCRKEAENFLQQGNIIRQQLVQIPGPKAAKVLPLLAEMGLITGAVTIKIGVEGSRREAFEALLEETCGQQITPVSDFTGELESRTEPFKIGGDADPKLIH